MANIFCTGVHTSILYRHTYTHTYLGLGGGVWPPPPSAHGRAWRPPLPGLDTAYRGPAHHLCLTCSHLATACAPPSCFLLLISATRAGCFLPPAHIPSAASLQPPRPGDGGGALRLWLPTPARHSHHRGRGVESPKPEVGQLCELFKIKTKTPLTGPSCSIHLRRDVGGRAESWVSTP